MQALKSLFARARTQVQATAVEPAVQPVELSAEDLKLVGGGLPRVGGELPSATTLNAIDDPDSLPRVG